MSPGRIVILSGPSGVGKDTVIEAWRQREARVRRVVAYTTREPRPGEEDGVDYHFVDRETFDRMAAAGEFLEWKEVHGNGYATPLRDLERMLAEGTIAILKIDVQGAQAVRRLRPDALSIFLLPPSMEELEERIRGRNQDAPEAIERRLATARQEIEQSGGYDHRIVNDEIEACVDRIQAAVAA